MRSRLVISALVALSMAACAATQTAPRQRMSTKQIVEVSKPAIVRVESNFGNGPAGDARLGVGTGFIVHETGFVATNLHVIRGSADITITLLDGSKRPVKRVVAADPARDLAIVEVEGEGYPALPLGDSDGIAAGDHVIAIGNPLGVLDYTVSDGLISSVRMVTEQLTVIQITAPISEGSSGGPLFNNYGEVIGVTTMFANEGQNLNFGVPSNYLRAMLAEPGEGYTPEEFARKFGLDSGVASFGPDSRPPTARVPPGAENVRIQRRVPHHEMHVLEGCSDEALIVVYRGIGEAIAAGAPLYNQGNHEACYRVYEGAALRFERDLECRGVREALGAGLLRAETMASYTEKAWAMRDAFDGILDVIMRRARDAQPQP